MSTENKDILPNTHEDVTKLLIQLLKDPNHGMYGSYGYEIYLPHLVMAYLERSKKQNRNYGSNRPDLFEGKSALFYSAAWELCRRGIIRPGISEYRGQATDEGNAGNGYSITPFGRQWLAESHDTFVPTEPERFGQMIAEYKKRFGWGFHQRAQEAVRCYGAHAYLACCVMCGAAVESILLATAIAKESDEAKILSMYQCKDGRKKIENLLTGKAEQHLKNEFSSHQNLLKYWRDEAGHGTTSQISENEAYTALAMLLRLALFVNNNWKALTT